jgi:hypothetical protein
VLAGLCEEHSIEKTDLHDAWDAREANVGGLCAADDDRQRRGREMSRMPGFRGGKHPIGVVRHAIGSVQTM